MKKTLIIIIFLSFFKTYSFQNQLQINNQISILEKKNDSLSKRLDKIEKEDYKSVEVIDKVNDFYDNAWNRLIIFLSFAGSIIIFVVPYLLSKNQEEKIALKSKEFDDLITSKINSLESKIKAFHEEQFNILRNEIGTIQSDLDKKIDDQIEYLQVYIFALRGLIAETEKKYDQFFSNYISSGYKLISLSKEVEIKTLIDSMIPRIEKCISENIKIEKRTKTKLETFIKSIEKNYYEQYNEIIDKLKNKIQNMETL